MHKIIDFLGVFVVLAIFAAFVFWASILIPIALGVTLILVLLFLVLTSLVDQAHWLWRRIRAPPGRRRER